jgi:hypothetical protein
MEILIEKATASRYYWWWYGHRCYHVIVGIVLCGIFRDGQIGPRRDSAFVTAVFVPGYVSLRRVVKKWNQLVPEGGTTKLVQDRYVRGRWAL